MDLESIFSWENATKKEPIQVMVDYYGKQDYPPDIYGELKREKGRWSAIRGYFVFRFDDLRCGGYCSIDGDSVNNISIKKFLSSLTSLSSIDELKILKSSDDSITDVRSILLKIQEKNPIMMKSRSREMVGIKSFLARINCIYVKPGRRRRREP